MRILVTLLAAILFCSGEVFAQHPKEITNSIGMKLVLIPPGKYKPSISPTSAAPESSLGGTLANEKTAPGKETTIGEGFYFGAYEVTNEQFAKFADDINLKLFPDPRQWYPRPKPDARDRFRVKPEDREFPVNPGWVHATLFCRLLSELPEEKRAGRAYRLPFAAEWEYCCRAGTTTRFSFGDSEDELGDYAWFKGNEPNGFRNVGWRPNGGVHPTPQLHRVGEKKPNPWGLYDMYGSMSEWCGDLVKGKEIPVGISAYEYRQMGEPFRKANIDFLPYRSIRGGSVMDDADRQALMDTENLQAKKPALTVSNNLKDGYVWHSDSSYHVGFRVAMISTGRPSSPTPSNPSKQKLKGLPEKADRAQDK